MPISGPPSPKFRDLWSDTQKFIWFDCLGIWGSAKPAQDQIVHLLGALFSETIICIYTKMAYNKKYLGYTITVILINKHTK